MKVAVLISKFPSVSETFILREFVELKKNGIDFEIFSLKKGQRKNVPKEAFQFKVSYSSFFKSLFSFLYFLFTKPIKTITIPFYLIFHNLGSVEFLLKSLFIIPRSFYFAKMIQEKKYNHIHSHWATIPTTSAVIISKLLNVSFSFTSHAWDIFVNQTMLKEKIKKSKFVVTCTGHNKKFLDKFGDPSKIHVVYHGLDVSNFKPKRKVEEMLLLTVGRLCRTKGYFYLFKAYRLLKKKGIKFRAVIIGKGEMKDKLLNYVNKYDLPVEFKGAVSLDKVKEFYNKSSIFVLPCIIPKNNDRDGIPNVLMESMALEVPVLTTNVSGIPELVKDGKNGLLVKTRDSVSLANAIEKLLNDNKLRTRLGKAGRKTIIKEFDVKNHIKKLVDLYKREII